jgi:hypothetical protein
MTWSFAWPWCAGGGSGWRARPPGHFPGAGTRPQLGRQRVSADTDSEHPAFDHRSWERAKAAAGRGEVDLSRPWRPERL